MQIPEVLLLKQFYFMLIKNVGLLLYIASFWGAGLRCRIEATVWVLLFLKFLVEISEALLVDFEWICAAVLWRTEQCVFIGDEMGVCILGAAILHVPCAAQAWSVPWHLCGVKSTILNTKFVKELLLLSRRLSRWVAFKYDLPLRVSVIWMLSKIFLNYRIVGTVERVESLSKSFLTVLFLTVEMLLTKNIFMFVQHECSPL